MHLAQAAYGQIDLSAAAAEATRKNYELVADAYARGTLSIIELLDAQDASVSAAAASVDSLYNFLITIMAVQRAVVLGNRAYSDDEWASELRSEDARSFSLVV